MADSTSKTTIDGPDSTRSRSPTLRTPTYLEGLMCPASFLNELDDIAYYTPDEIEASSSETQELELEQMAFALERNYDFIFSDLNIITQNRLVKKSLQSKLFKKLIRAR